MDHGASEHVPGVTLKSNQTRCRISLATVAVTPSLSLIMVTEFHSDHVHIRAYFGCFYLAMPFGWNGAPSHCAFFGDAIAMAHVQCGLNRASTLMRHSFRSVLYVDGVVFADVNVPERLFAATQRWGHLAKCVLGAEAINRDKLDEEGHWGPTRFCSVSASILTS